MTDQIEEHKIMTTLNSSFEAYMTNSLHVSFIFVLAIASLFFTLNFIVHICLLNKQNNLFRLFVKKILSLNHKPKQLQNPKVHQNSKHLEVQNDLNISKQQKRFLTQITFMDPVLVEDFKNSKLFDYMESNLIDSIFRFSEQTRKFLNASRWSQYLSLYQPFLILCIVCLNLNGIVWLSSSEIQNGNLIPGQSQNTIDQNSGVKMYVGISMMGVSLLIYLIFNCSNCFFNFLQRLSLKQSKKKAVNLILTTESTHHDTMISSDKKLSLKIIGPTEKKLVSEKSIKEGKVTIPFKLRNSLKIFHLIYLIPIFVFIILMLTAEFQL